MAMATFAKKKCIIKNPQLKIAAEFGAICDAVMRSN